MEKDKVMLEILNFDKKLNILKWQIRKFKLIEHLDIENLSWL